MLPDLFIILLQIMDHGTLTDHNGKSVSFRNIIIIMTTNAGSAEMSKPALGFEREERDVELLGRLAREVQDAYLASVGRWQREAWREDENGLHTMNVTK